MSNGFGLSVTAARPALLAGSDNTVEVAVRIQAPDTPEGGPRRPRLNMALVIDRSGSMSGQPLQEAKRCAITIIDRLNATDIASVIAYDDHVRVVAEAQPVKNKERLKAAVARIQEGGSTNLHGGWLKGAEEAAKNLSASTVSRVLLLSDVNANSGITNIDEVASQCAQLAETGVTTSTYGLGHSFNEDLMVAMARSGRGREYYSETADALLERFQEEFSLLEHLCGRDVRLRVKALPELSCELLNLYLPIEEGCWRLPDLAYGGEAWAAFRLQVKASCVPHVGQKLNLMQVAVHYRKLDGSKCAMPKPHVSLPVLNEEDFRKLPEDETVKQYVNEAEAARLQELTAQAARAGDWKQVDALLVQAPAMAAKNPLLQKIFANLKDLADHREADRLSKEGRYAARSMGVWIRSKNVYPGASMDALPEYLRRRVHQGRKHEDDEK